MSKNDITGDSLRSKELSQQGKDNWDLIFGDFKKNNSVEIDTIHRDTGYGDLNWQYSSDRMNDDIIKGNK